MPAMTLFPYPYVVSVFLVFWTCSAWLDFVFFAPFLPLFGALSYHFPVWVFVIFKGFWWGFWYWVDDGAATCWSVVVFVAVVVVEVVVVVPPEDFGAVHACWSDPLTPRRPSHSDRFRCNGRESKFLAESLLGLFRMRRRCLVGLR